MLKQNGQLKELVNGSDAQDAVTKSQLDGVASTIPDVSTLVPKTTTVNGQPLSSNVTVSKNDVGLGNADNTSDANKPVSTATQAALNTKFNTPSGTTAQYVRGDGTLATLPTTPSRSFATPSRSIVTSTSSQGFQPSSNRDAFVAYEGTFQTTSTIGGPSSITVFLETADTNSTTPGDWTTVATQVNSNTITLAIVLQQVDIEPWSLSRIIPAGKWVRIRSGSVTGTASAAVNAQQQEVLL